LTASEDFSFFGLTERQIPLCFFGLGMIDPQKAPCPLHSPQVAPLPEPTILTGVAAMAAAVLELMPIPKHK
jgi:hippurate hydrolase